MATLEQLKTQASILPDNVEHDILLSRLLAVAKSHVEQIIGRTIPWVDANNVEVPVPPQVEHATLMIAADLFENREAGIAGVSYALHPLIDRMLWPYRDGLGV